jgi:hypothetical protein
MNTEHEPVHDPVHDPVRDALAPIAARTWERPEHQLHLERELREQLSMKPNLWAKAALITGIFVAGGIAGASTLAWWDHYFVEETDLPGDTTHIRITDTTTQEVVMDEEIGDDEAIFMIEGTGGGDDTLLRLRPVDGPGDTEPDDTKPEDP